MSSLAHIEADFGLKILSTTGINDTCIFSPLSILLSLSLVHLGAHGHTKHQIRDVIAPSSTDDTFVDYFKNINNLVNFSLNGVEATVANRLFVAPEQAIKQNYVNDVMKYYNAETQKVDFKNVTEAAKIINKYISDNTKGKIPDMVKSDGLDGVDAMLVNAIYFEADWREKFDSAKEAKFWRSEKESRDVLFLSDSSENYKYAEDDVFQVAAIQYKDKSAWFLILLPKTRFGLADAFQKLDGARFQKLVSSLVTHNVYLKMPKFKLTNKLDLTKILGKLGLAELFTERADLSNIGPGLQLSTATHQAMIEVDEWGTRAAASTETKVYLVSGSSEEPKNVIADHPFLFAVLKDNVPLFMGIYN